MAAQNSLSDNDPISRQIKSFSSQLTHAASLGLTDACSRLPPIKPLLCWGSNIPDVVTLRVMPGSHDDSCTIARLRVSLSPACTRFLGNSDAGHVSGGSLRHRWVLGAFAGSALGAVCSPPTAPGPWHMAEHHDPWLPPLPGDAQPLSLPGAGSHTAPEAQFIAI